MHVVGAVLVVGDHIVMARRAATLKSYPGYYEFPGGKVELAETHPAALARELREELDIVVQLADIESFEGNSTIHTIKGTGKEIYLTLFLIRKWEGTLRTKEGIHSELRAILLQDLYNFKGLIPGDQSFVPAIQAAVVAPKSKRTETRTFWGKVTNMRHNKSAALSACDAVALVVIVGILLFMRLYQAHDPNG